MKSECINCRKTTKVRVKIAASLSHTGKEYWKNTEIDYCIAPIVNMLQKIGVDMLGSCCGHGKQKGVILLA